MLIVQVKDKNINRALKELKSKFIKARITKELLERKNFKKKSVREREEVLRAIYRNKKDQNNKD